jgi:hypothetical protein
MMRLGFKLVTKTVSYWIEIFTVLWDGFINESKPQYYEFLHFRSELQNKNWSYLVQLIEVQFCLMSVYNYSKISLVLGGLYLVARMALQ